MNDCIFTGRLTAKPELKATSNGVPVCSFSLAIKRPRRKDVTDFINFVAWRHTAEFICKYFGKGDMLACKGALTARKYQDGEGKNRIAFEVEVEAAEFCGGKSTGNTTEAPTEDQPQYEEIADDDTLPF